MSNLFNERYFRARTGAALGNVLEQAMPDRRWQLMLKTPFWSGRVRRRHSVPLEHAAKCVNGSIDDTSPK